MMRKKLLLGLFCTLIASLGYAQSEYKVTANSLNVRSEASTNASKLGGLTKGQTVLVFSIDGDWAIIDYKDQFGYVSKQYIEPIQPIQPVVETSDTPSLDTEFADVNSTPSMETEFANNQGVQESNPLSYVDEPCILFGVGIGYSYSFNKVKEKIQNDGFHGFPLYLYVNYEIGKHMGIWGDLGYAFYQRKYEEGAKFKVNTHHFCMDAHFSVGGYIRPDMLWIVHGGPGMNILARTVKDYDDPLAKDESSSKSKFDLMFGLGTALGYKHFTLSFAFNWGVLNMNKDVKNAPSSYQRNLNVSLIYNFF